MAFGVAFGLGMGLAFAASAGYAARSLDAIATSP